MRYLFLVVLVLSPSVLFLATVSDNTDIVWASSICAPPRTGLEPPGGPKKMEVLPGGRSVGRTPEGGMGYTDAYGNTISSRVPENNSARSRLRPGAYGVMRAAPRPERPLPDSSHQSPAWSFK